jgi:hypothetical protein
MKVLIATLSCHSLRHCEKDARETWIPEIPSGVDYKFFLGLPSAETEPDEVILDVGDGWQDITKKSVAAFRWALEHGYDYCFKCDLDTLVRPVLLLSSGFEQHDYIGGRNTIFASGGAGYWLSRRAMETVVADPRDQGQAEDVHTAQALLDKGFSLHADPRYKFIPGQPLGPEDFTAHLTSLRAWDAKYQPQWMHEAHSARGTYWPLGDPKHRPLRFSRRLR